MLHEEFCKTMKSFDREVGDDWKYAAFLKDIQSAYGESDEKTADVLLEFLNKWGRMRLPRSEECLHSLANAVNTARPFIEQFRVLELEETDLKSLLSVGAESLYVQTAVVVLCETFNSVGNKFADVAATKCLHLLAPSFFVIWDNNTRDNTTDRCRSFSGRYAFRFLPKVQHDVRELISDTQTKLTLTRAAAIAQLQAACSFKRTMAKWIDEYYYARYTKGYCPKVGADRAQQ